METEEVVDTEMFTQQRVNERIRARELAHSKKLIDSGARRAKHYPLGRVRIESSWFATSGKQVFLLECCNGHNWTEIRTPEKSSIRAMKLSGVKVNDMFSCPMCADSNNSLEIRHVEAKPFDPNRPVKGNGILYTIGIVGDESKRVENARELSERDYQTLSFNHLVQNGD